MRRIVFLDMETTGLEHDDEPWEIAAITRDYDSLGGGTEHHMFVQHDPRKAQKLPEPFRSDYLTRYDPATAVPRAAAAATLDELLGAAVIVGAVPGFDAGHAERLLAEAGLSPCWHYQLVDVEALAAGYLANSGGQFTSWHSLIPPWDSDVLSRAVGVEPPAQGEGRHTALGDVRWSRDVFDKIVHGQTP